MFVKPRGLVSARCYLDGHDSCIAELCDCDCHVAKVEFRGENAEAATQTAYSGRCGQVIPLHVGTWFRFHAGSDSVVMWAAFLVLP